MRCSRGAVRCAALRGWVSFSTVRYVEVTSYALIDWFGFWMGWAGLGWLGLWMDGWSIDIGVRGDYYVRL